jgi:hypothetical protein
MTKIFKDILYCSYIMQKTKQKYVSEKIKLYYKKIFRDNKVIENMKQKRIKKMQDGGFNKVYNSVRRRIYNTFQKFNIPFDRSYDEIIGCTEAQLELYIFNKLKPDMTFENYGEWEIDHIIPVSHFKFEDKSDIAICFHYTNLQPLWFKENRQKSDKIVCDDIQL